MTDKVEYPEHLDPEIIKGALFVHNAPDKEEADNRIKFLAEHLGNHKMCFVMAMLMLPFLMDIVEKSEEYKDYFDKYKKKTLN